MCNNHTKESLPQQERQANKPACSQSNFLPGFHLLRCLQISKTDSFSSSPSTAYPARARLRVGAQLVPRASLSPSPLPFGPWKLCPSSMFFTHVSLFPFEDGEREVPRYCSHSITEDRNYHACPTCKADKERSCDLIQPHLSFRNSDCRTRSYFPHQMFRGLLHLLFIS